MSGRTGTAVAAMRFTGRTATESKAPVPILPPQPQGRDMADVWPLNSYLELGALPTAVGCARGHAKLVLSEWGLEPLTETVELLVSEIVTNAVRAAKDLTASRVCRTVDGRDTTSAAVAQLRQESRAHSGLGCRSSDAGATGDR